MKKISSPSPQRPRCSSSASKPSRNSNVKRVAIPSPSPQRPRCSSSASKPPSRNSNVKPRVARDDHDDDVNNKFIGSMRNLFLVNNKTSKLERKKNKVVIKEKVTTKIQIGSFVHQNLITWIRNVFTTIGPNKKEIAYHIELKRLLLSKGFDVGYEVPLKYERQGEQKAAVISRRVDLILSMPGISEQILIECKAKKKITKKDFEQVIFYRQHFGILDCYLVNFRPDPEVLRLKEEDDVDTNSKTNSKTNINNVNK